MSYRLARSLRTLRSQVNAGAPQRSKASDGWIGDAAHRKRRSDHNPNSRGVVQAIDLTHDPHGGFDAHEFFTHLRRKRDPRIKYIISDGRIVSSSVRPWQERKYRGSNAHRGHLHISVVNSPAKYDDPAPWNLRGFDFTPDESAARTLRRPTLRKGSRGTYVRRMQQILGLKVDGIFGQKTERGVREFQRARKLLEDGVVGAVTWSELEEAGGPAKEKVSEPRPSKGLPSRIGPSGLAIVKAFEGCHRAVRGRPGYFRAYRDPVGVLTIGWGHTNHHSPKFGPSAVWSQAKCDEVLRSDMRVFEQHVRRLAKVPLTQFEFDALVSWAYNTGGPASATLWRKLNAGDKSSVPKELAKWNRGGGRVLRGLIRRRKAEGLLFLGKLAEAKKVAGK